MKGVSEPFPNISGYYWLKMWETILTGNFMKKTCPVPDVYKRQVLNYLSKMIIDKVSDTENNSSTVNKNIDKIVRCV